MTSDVVTRASSIEAGCAADLPDVEKVRLYSGDVAVDNYLRARGAAVGVRAYAELMGVSTEGWSTSIGDLLGDVRHLCDAVGVDFEQVNAAGYDHYSAELRGDA